MATSRGIRRAAQVAAHITSQSLASGSVTLAPVSVAAGIGTPTNSGDDEHTVVMLDRPAEEAVAQDLVENMFATHGLAVSWANNTDVAAHRKATALVTVKNIINAEVLDRFPALRLVAVAFTGYDHVDLEECRKRGISVANVPGYSTDGVAELCFGLIFAILRHIPIAHQHIRNGKWAWPPGNELSGKSMGIIGTGQIGIRVSEIARAFKVKRLLAYSNTKHEKFIAQLGGEYVPSLATLFLHADIVVVCVALSPKTRGLVSRKLLKLLRPDSILINCARGAIIDQDAMTEMLAEGRFRAGLDVYDVEPLPEDHGLRSIPESHLVTVPHIAYKCHESLKRRQDVTLANILAFFSDNPQNIVS